MEGGFLTGVGIEGQKKEQNNQQSLKLNLDQNTQQNQDQKNEQQTSQKPQENTSQQQQKPKRLEPLEHKPKKVNKSQTTKALPKNNLMPNNQKRQSFQNKELAPIKHKNERQMMSQTHHASKSTFHLGEHKLKSFKSVMDQVKDSKQEVHKKERKNMSESHIDDENKYQRRHNFDTFQRNNNSNLFLERYNIKIKEDIKAIYDLSENSRVLEELQRLENKQFIKTEISRRENLINKQKKIYNNKHYDMLQKEKQLHSLMKAIEKVNVQLRQGSQMDEYNKATARLQEIEGNYEDNDFRKETLERMVYDRKKVVKSQIKSVQQLQFEILRIKREKLIIEEELMKYGTNKNNRQKAIEELKSLVQQYQNALKYEQVYVGQHFEDQFEDQLSEYEDKKALKQIFMHEAIKKEEHEREQQEQRIQQLNKNREEKKKKQDATNKEMQEIKFIFNQETDKFAKLEKTTGINVEMIDNILKSNQPYQMKQEIEKLEKILDESIDLNDPKKVSYLQEIEKDRKKNIYIRYKESLERDKVTMEKVFRKKYEQDIQNEKSEIEDLKKRIEYYKYDEKSNEKNYDPNIIENLDKQLIQEKDLTQDQENQLRRVEKIIDNICIVISRISYQLPFGKQNKDRNVKVLRKDLLDQISICGLQLEKMLAILSKKKDTIRIESVNTASDNKAPPEYLGLNNKIFKSIQQQNPKYTQDVSQRIDESLDSEDLFPVRYMGIQQYIYAEEKLQKNQNFDYKGYADPNNESREDDRFVEEARRTIKENLEKQKLEQN